VVSDLAVGSHLVTASYGGVDPFSPSTSDPLTHVVEGVADAGGPYTIDEGESVTLDASGTQAGATASYSWDLDGDGSFDDAAGADTTLTWEQLVALGIDDGDSTHQITLQVTDGTDTFTAVTALTVLNAPAVVTFDGPTTATAGQPITIKVGADDPSPVDMAGTFIYTVDWGDGSPPVTESGPADPPFTHTYTAPGSYTLSATVTDPDGTTSDPFTLTFSIVEQAPTTTAAPATTSPPPTATTSPAGAVTTTTVAGALPRTGSDHLAVGIAIAVALSCLGAITLLATRRSIHQMGHRRSIG
jgi:hypothetical protein